MNNGRYKKDDNPNAWLEKFACREVVGTESVREETVDEREQPPRMFPFFFLYSSKNAVFVDPFFPKRVAASRPYDTTAIEDRRMFQKAFQPPEVSSMPSCWGSVPGRPNRWVSSYSRNQQW